MNWVIFVLFGPPFQCEDVARWQGEIYEANPVLEPWTIYQVARGIVDGAEMAGLDQELVAAVCYVESRFNPSVVSRAGAIGTMQVVPRWHPWVRAEELTDPYLGTIWGCLVLGAFVEDWGLEEGLRRYGASRKYVSRVLDKRAEYGGMRGAGIQENKAGPGFEGFLASQWPKTAPGLR